MKKKKTKRKVNQEWIHPGVLSQFPKGETSLDSLDVPLRDSEGILTGETLLNSLEQPDPHGLENFERLQDLILSHVHGKNKQVIRMWIEGYTYKEIGKEVKIVKQRVEQIVNDLIRKLNKPHIAKSILKGDYKL